MGTQRTFDNNKATLEQNNSASFSEMLKAFRKRQKMTQQQLARRLGVHYNTIGAWERGDYLPATRGLIVELARCLHLNKVETHHFLDASLNVVSFRWWIPYQRNPFFTGRQEFLQQLSTLLSTECNSSSNRSYALSGLAAIGKTQIALEYAYKHILNYSAVFWICAETQEDITSSLLTIIKILNLPVSDSLDEQGDEITIFLGWLTTHYNWLVIFDDVQDITLLKRFFPFSHTGSFLFTTRLPTLGTLAHSIIIPPLSNEESRTLLLRRTGLLPLTKPAPVLAREEEEAAQALVAVLDGLPLALDQVATYQQETHCSLVELSQLFQYHATQLLQTHPSSLMYPYSVAKTFTLAMQSLRRQNPAAADLLLLCCFLAADAIPEALFIKGIPFLPSELQAALSEPFLRNALFKDLLAHALLQRDTHTHTLHLHRLIQTVLLATLSQDEQRNRVDTLLRLLDHLLALEAHANKVIQWRWYEQILPHAQSLLQVAEQLEIVTPALISALNEIASYLLQRARFALAQRALFQAHSAQKALFGPASPILIPTLVRLAQTYLAQGTPQAAEALYQHALQLSEAVSETEPLDLAEMLQDLAGFYAYWKEQRQEEAKTLYQRALHIYTQEQGSRSLNVAATLSALATLYLYQADYSQAETLFLQAQDMREQLLIAPHSELAGSLHDLGLLYMQQGRYQEAEALLRRCLSWREELLGAEHIDVIESLGALASLLVERGSYEQAEPLYHRALLLSRQLLAAHHPLVAHVLSNLATLFALQARKAEAETAAKQAYLLYEQTLEEGHRRYAGPLQIQALLAYQCGQYVEAEALCSQAYAIRERALPPHHPSLAETMHLQANIRRAQKDFSGAESLYAQAWEVYQQSFGSHHPVIARLSRDWAMQAYAQDRWEQAEQRYREALSMWEEFRELNHPDYADCLEQYAALLERLQGEQEADSDLLQVRENHSRYQANNQKKR